MNIYPEKVKKIVESGNTAGLHSVSHDIHKLYKTSISAKEEFDLNNQTLGHYTVTYFFKGKTYHLKIEVIDTKKPTIKEYESLKIELFKRKKIVIN